MFKCDTCIYANFKYNENGWKLRYIYCKRLKNNLSSAGYRRLKFCNFYEKRV